MMACHIVYGTIFSIQCSLGVAYSLAVCNTQDKEPKTTLSDSQVKRRERKKQNGMSAEVAINNAMPYSHNSHEIANQSIRAPLNRFVSDEEAFLLAYHGDDDVAETAKYISSR